MTRNILPKIIVFTALVLVASFFFKNTAKSPVITSSNPVSDSTPTVQEFPKDKYSLTSPSSLWVIVNKNRQLSPVDYAPDDLRSPKVPLRGAEGSEEMMLAEPAAKAVEDMFNAAEKEGVQLKVASAYRSYATQTSVYNNEVNRNGQSVADTQSARPGHSEHQTGLTVDIQDFAGQCVIEDCFGELSEGVWLQDNAWKYGFVLRYPQDKSEITGYRYEPWHFRYVGVELSTELNKQKNTTLEEFFGIVEPLPY